MIGVCSVCHKSIPSPKLLINFSGKSYHTTCFNCSSCGEYNVLVLCRPAYTFSLVTGCSMTGQPIYERNGSILCVRDYQRLSGPQAVPNSHQVHSQSQKQWRQQQNYRTYNQQVCLSQVKICQYYPMILPLALCLSILQLAAQAPQGHYHYHHRHSHMQRSAGPGTAV